MRVEKKNGKHPRALSRGLDKMTGSFLRKIFCGQPTTRLPLINARRAVGERERGGVDNWNYVKKALVRKDGQARRRLEKKGRVVVT